MAVPKKKTSKSKKNSRKSSWKKKVLKESNKSLSMAKLILLGNSNRSIYFDSGIFSLGKSK